VSTPDSLKQTGRKSFEHSPATEPATEPGTDYTGAATAATDYPPYASPQLHVVSGKLQGSEAVCLDKLEKLEVSRQRESRSERDSTRESSERESTTDRDSVKPPSLSPSDRQVARICSPVAHAGAATRLRESLPVITNDKLPTCVDSRGFCKEAKDRGKEAKDRVREVLAQHAKVIEQQHAEVIEENALLERKAHLLPSSQEGSSSPLGRCTQTFQRSPTL